MQNRKEQKNIQGDKLLALIAMNVTTIIVCSYISFPFLTTIAVTMQTFAVFIAPTLFGTRRSLIALITYLFMGAVGMPVFSMFRGGITAFLEPSGGFFLGFIISTVIIGYAVKRFGRKRLVMLVSMLISQVLCYLCGMLWFMVYMPSFYVAFAVCVLPFIIPDLAKIFLVIALSPKLGRVTDCFLYGYDPR